MFKPVLIATALGLLLAADAGCKKKGEETEKPAEVADDDGAAGKGETSPGFGDGRALLAEHVLGQD